MGEHGDELGPLRAASKVSTIQPKNPRPSKQANKKGVLVLPPLNPQLHCEVFGILNPEKGLNPGHGIGSIHS